MLRFALPVVFGIAILSSGSGCTPAHQGSGCSYGKSAYYPTEWDTLLVRAFKHSDTSCVQLFFREWQRAGRPETVIEEHGMDDTVAALYELYNAFRGLKDTLVDRPYVVLQNSIRYAVAEPTAYDSLSRVTPSRRFDRATMKWETAFQPTIPAGARVVYLDEEHECVLNYFFNETNGSSSCVPEEMRERLRAKAEFVGEYIQITQQHWVLGFNYLTWPALQSVVFSPNLSEAQIWYQDTWCSGGRLEFVRTDSGWVKVVGAEVVTWVM